MLAALDSGRRRALVSGRYEKKTGLEGSFSLDVGDADASSPGAFKVSGMSLKISPSSDLSNPDTYLFVP